MKCPHCDSPRVMRNGWNCNTRKYKCSNPSCKRQFSETSVRFAARVEVNAPKAAVSAPVLNACGKCGKAITGRYRKGYDCKEHLVCPKPDEKPRGRFLLFQSARTGALIR